jgi:hypothetical protein
MKARRLRTLALAPLLAVALVLAVSSCAIYINPHPGVLYVTARPPEPRVEVVIASLGPGRAWVPGHWAWRVNEYVWLPGVGAPVAPGYTMWVPGRWAHDHHGWFWIDGRWR